MAKINIMIVEDDAITAMDIENQLKNLGYGVTAKVAYGEEAIQKAKENTPDLVLMDIVLKGKMDGIEAAEEIRTQFGIPVVFLTAFADKKRIERAKITMPFGFILKPFQDRDFKVTIEMALYVAKVDTERKRAEEALRKAHKELEQRVNERTAELVEANEQLNREIEDRKQAEEALRESEKRYREIVEGTDDLITRLDSEARFTYVNHVAERIFGITVEKCIGMSAFDPIHPDDREKTDKEFSKWVKNRLSNTTFENRQVNQTTGDIHEMHWAINLYYDEKGNLTGLSSIARDLTDRKKAEDQVKASLKEKEKSEEKYRQLFSKVSDAIIIYDINSQEIVDVNGTACRWYGYSHEEFCKLKLTDVSAEFEKSSEVFKKQARNKEVHVPIRYNKKKDGTIFPVEISSGPAIELGGRSLGFGIFRDLSEKKGSV